jgi:SHS family lactate transporter-like MFS transporter
MGGFSTSYRMLFMFRALFGIGMGGVWAAGMPLAIEHWPVHLRGRVSGMLQSGYSTGFLLSALTFSFVYPLVNTRPDFGWRVMLWIGVLPALLVLWIMGRVSESPVWLDRQKDLRSRQQRSEIALPRLFKPDLIATTIHASLVMSALLCFYYSVTFWYPTLIAGMHRSTLPYLVALNVGTMLGNLTWGHFSESRLGRRGAATIATLGGISVIPMYVFSRQPAVLLGGGFLMGLFGVGNFGVVPSYLNERFPTAARAAGAGLAYHTGAAASSLMPFIVGAMQDRGIPLANAMAICIAITGTLVVIAIWIGPETRGKPLTNE